MAISVNNGRMNARGAERALTHHDVLPLNLRLLLSELLALEL